MKNNPGFHDVFLLFGFSIMHMSSDKKRKLKTQQPHGDAFSVNEMKGKSTCVTREDIDLTSPY